MILNLTSTTLSLSEISVFFCGPPPLAESIKKEIEPYDGKFQLFKENF